MMNCEPCGKSFTGEVSYNQHLKSDKHLRKVKNLEMLKNDSSKEFATEGISDASTSSAGPSFNCPTCNISFGSFTDYQFHSISSIHITNVQSIKNKEDFSSYEVSSSIPEDTTDGIHENTHSSSIDEADKIIAETQSFKLSFTDCKICSKHFSGPESYRQHMESIGHKKKIEMENALHGNISSTFECNICNKTFSGHIPYQQHMTSEIHRKKLETSKILWQLKENMQLESVLECNSINNKEDFNSYKVSSSTSEDTTDHINESIYLSSIDKGDMIMSETQSFKLSYKNCTICSKHFSGPESYRQHIESIGHKKKIEMESALQQNISTFECNICKKVFSGHIPYQQHMSSEIHKKKVGTANMLQQMKGNMQLESVSECNMVGDTQNSSKLDTLKATTVDNPWYCKYCDVYCSGHVPYAQHLGGTVHQKNLKRGQLENNLNKSDVKQQYVLNPEILQQSTTSESSNQSNKFNINNKLGLNQKLEHDYILPQGIENLKVMSVDELNLTEILPHMKIEFDKFENENYASPKISANESKEENKENAYRKCKFCNVKLMNEKETIEHYESFEHTKKSMEYFKMNETNNVLMEF